MRLRAGSTLKGCWLVMAVLAMTACSGGEKSAEPQPVQPAQAEQPAAKLRKVPLQVRLLPAEAAAGSCLQAVVTGGGKVAYVWRVNDAVQVEHAAKLCTDGSRRGDQVSVTVTGGDDQEGYSELTLGNSPPTVAEVTSEPKLFYRGVDVTVTPVGQDRDGDSLSYKYQWRINGKTNPVDDGPTLAGDRFSKGDRLVVEITANDGYEDGPTSRSREIVVPNAPPQFVSEPPKILPLPDFKYQPQATDPDDDPLTFALLEGPEGMEIDAQSGLLTWQLPEKLTGSISVKVQVQDADGASAVQSFTLALERN